MAKNKDDIKYGTAQAKLSEDETLRVRYKAGTPIEGGKIADSEPVDLFSGARRISDTHSDAVGERNATTQSQLHRTDEDNYDLNKEKSDVIITTG
ncbi:PREDICTED: uncharacterized protein LOC104590007 [Nelumbo nucifera]|uniref:Seed maturation protein n=2 Tax=Nelumbo nucifera TaxID=4432 RepID=A0A822ZEW9_NELNU|nr:PREDICTED: uncharacterized protein LOC104590007 [Nelumbo nucifera]DAD43672.1 TPA_asm: hypothetical protein HUJ06_001902 [Nelumbo nucifera]